MSEQTHPALSRRLIPSLVDISVPLLIFYGLGTTVGAGSFVLIGKVAGRAGIGAPASFLAASVLAAFSFAELVARNPRSAGEAIYVREGFGSHRLARTSHRDGAVTWRTGRRARKSARRDAAHRASALTQPGASDSARRDDGAILVRNPG